MSSMENQKRSILVFFSWIFMVAAMGAESTTTIPVNVGVVVDLDEPSGKMYLSCIEMALSDFYASHAHYKTRLVLNTRNSNGDVVGAAAAGLIRVAIGFSICSWIRSWRRLYVEHHGWVMTMTGTLIGGYHSLLVAALIRVVLELRKWCRYCILGLFLRRCSVLGLVGWWFVGLCLWLDLIKNVEVKAILGPVSSMQASFVVNLGEQAHVPIISFSATSPSLTSLQSSYFFRFAQNDLNQVKAISSIVQNFGWRRVVPIYVDNMYGEGVIPFLIDALQEVDAHIPHRSLIHELATDDQIEKELYKLMTMQTRVFIVHMMPNLSSRLFAKAKEMGMMSEGYVWITTNGIGNNLRSMASVLDLMQGLLGVESYIPRTLKLRQFISRWKRKFQQDNPKIIDVQLDFFGLRAYDAAFAVAMAFEKVANVSFKFQKRNASSFNSTDLDTFEVSHYGSKLSHALSIINFKGMAGNFNLVDRQLNVSTFKIVNVNGDAPRTVGYWTPENGKVVKRLNSTRSRISTSMCDLRPIIWPGESLSVPKGWEIPTNGTKLRIGVPVKEGFLEFLKVTRYPSTNTVDVTGFVIDVFKAVLEILPYALPYEFIPFAKANGSSAGTYNDLVYQVYIGNFDAVLGDVTIRANRSLYVGFTMPYTAVDVVMVVPIQDKRTKSAWVFLKPLTWDLWMTTLCFFIFIGFVIWVLEHRTNDDFRGSPSHQIGTSFWFSFSTMVFSQRERVVNNLARFVMIIWIFVVLIVTQSYTASLASLLTVQQLQPTITDINDLLRNSENVGYLASSYIYGLLRQKGFHDSKLKEYGDMEEIDKALSKGSANGGIAAIVHETPYMKLFVFPKGSPLIPDVSQAILNLTEGEKIMNIEDKWIKENSCKDSSTEKFYSSSLGLESFWVLFLIAGVASIIALLIFAASFIHKHKQVLMSTDSRASKWKRIRTMFKIFNEKELSSRTYKSSSKHEARIAGAPDDEVNASPNDNWPKSPFSHTNQTDGTSVFYRQQETPSHDPVSPEIVPTVELAFTNQEMHAIPETTQERV
ncbi:putative periplasmic binding protein-like I [Rosa chinensis]|uniref:Putative periplasmic binding protein-like I n=1 Tax=Rosa chinensis TaxID=74649 RepID=A0A2P6Q7F4_ROSCH|nr:putative periplasmic binding protein-like I [Rosa chinensis]